MVKVTDEPISPATAYELIKSEGSGSVVFHYAVVKANAGGQETASIEYRQNGDVHAELEAIAGSLGEQYTLDDVLMVRRVGTLGVGEIISLVATSSPNSVDAFQACQHGISRMKKMSTIKKQEIFR